MAENEKKLIENVAALPKPLRDEFLSQLQGAATAVKVLASTTPAQEKTDEKGG